MLRMCSLVLAALLLVSGTAIAAEKIGVFNSQITAADSDAGKAAQKRMQSMFSGENSQLEKQAKDLQSQRESLQKQAAAMSQKVREEKQVDFTRKAREFDEKSRNFARRVEMEQAGINQTMAKLLFDSAAAVAKKNKLDLILDGGVPGIFYASDSLDVSNDMLSEMNRQWKAAGSKFTSPAARK